VTPPLPPPLMTSDPGSFARATIVERKPQIIAQVIKDQAYPPEILGGLEAFREELRAGVIQPLGEDAPDAALWNGVLAAFAGKTWLEVTWYFAETYFYRRLLEAVGYFQPGPWQGRNPFQPQKQRQMEADVRRLAADWDQLTGLEPPAQFEVLLHSCLWGNRTDLSNTTVKLRGAGGVAARDERHLILIDHTAEVAARLAQGAAQVDFINDNVGMDLFFDLALADFLLGQGWVRHIIFNLKGSPFFVSDAMPEDALTSIVLLKGAGHEALRRLGGRLADHVTANRLELVADPFWSTCFMFRQMPPVVRAALASSTLVVLKGDVNYRRLLDDAHWPHTARMEDVAGYFPAPFVTLRTLKGEIMVGLQPGQAEALAAEDPTWLINGKHGVIQLNVIQA
jgi:hypothetical protein